MLLDHKSMQRLAQGVLTQVASLLNVGCAGILVLRETAAPQESFCVLAGSGCYGHYAGREPAWPLEERVQPLVERAFAERRHSFGEHWSTLYLNTASGSEIVALIEADRQLSETDLASSPCSRAACRSRSTTSSSMRDFSERMPIWSSVSSSVRPN